MADAVINGRKRIGVIALNAPVRSVPVVKALSRGASGEFHARFERERRLLGAFGEKDGFVPLLDVIETPKGKRNKR